MKSGQWWRWSMRVILAGGLLAGVAAGAMYFFRPPQVTVAAAAVREIAPAIQGVGNVEAKTVVRVSAKITGRLVSVLADQGDTVRAGQLLATFDRAEQQAEARIRPPARQAAVVIPLGALVRTADSPGVWALISGRLTFRRVRLGVVDPAGWVEMLDGVREGEEVVVAPGRLADRGNDGRRVLVVRAQPTGRTPAGASGARRSGSSSRATTSSLSSPRRRMSRWSPR